MSENKLPSFGIRRVKEFSFLVNESLFELNKQVRIQFQHHTKFDAKTNFIDLTLRVFYSYDPNIPPSHILVDFHVQNIFELQDLKQYKTNSSEEYILPQNLIVSILGVAISHIRALMAHNVAGTLYQDNIIPIVNPLEVAKAFYPNMFKTNDNNQLLETELKTKKGVKTDRISKRKK